MYYNDVVSSFGWYRSCSFSSKRCHFAVSRSLCLLSNSIFRTLHPWHSMCYILLRLCVCLSFWHLHFIYYYEQQFVKSVCSESIWTVNRFSILFTIHFWCLSFLCFSFNSPAICGFLGFLFFNKSRTEQQTTLRILFAYYTIWSLPSESNGRYRASHGLELHFHYLRRKQLRHQGECVHVCILC